MRAVITVTGTDRRGVIASVSTFLAAKKVNIEDVSQTIMGDQFAMIMMVDASEIDEDFAVLAEEAAALGKEIGMDIHLRHADLFEAMHTI